MVLNFLLQVLSYLLYVLNNELYFSSPLKIQDKDKN